MRLSLFSLCLDYPQWRKIYNAIPRELLFYYFSLNGENQRDITILLLMELFTVIQREKEMDKK